MKFMATLCFLAALLPELAVAHGGGLDARGCHTNRKTGEYHCHRSGGATPQRTPLEGRSRLELKELCGTKYYCKEMGSCEEAIYYLVNCGLTRLDGDGDGIPCESICGSR